LGRTGSRSTIFLENDDRIENWLDAEEGFKIGK
jgi:hypothetical protein